MESYTVMFGLINN